MKVQKFKRGQIWWCKLANTFDGSVQGKSRPVIIMSNDLANKYSNCLLAIPVTTQSKKQMPTHTVFELNGVMNTALAENLMSVNINKLCDYLGVVDDELLSKLEDNILVALGLNTYENKGIQLAPLQLEPDIHCNCRCNTAQMNTQLEQTEIEPQVENKISELSELPIKLKRASKLKYNTDELKKEFINDYKNHDLDWMVAYYDEVSKGAVSNKYYRFTQYFKKKGIEI